LLLTTIRDHDVLGFASTVNSLEKVTVGVAIG
jgi:hypothetical protein